MELGSLQGFSHIVALHFIRWTVPYFNRSLRNLVCYEEVSYMDVPGPLTSTFTTILLQFDCTFVVLLQDVALHAVPLFLKEVLGPQCMCHSIIHCN